MAASSTPGAGLRFCAVVALSMVATATAACGKDDDKNASTPVTVDDADDPTLLAEDGTDASNAETDTQVVSGSLVAASGTTNGALSVGEGAEAIYLPKGCLTVTSDTASQNITYVFDSCFGPNGIAKITGTIAAHYAVTDSKLVLDLTGTNLTINRAQVDWSAHAEVSASGAMRTMTWNAQLSGTTARSRDFSRNNTTTLTWTLGDKCYAFNGESDGTVKERYVKTVISNFNRCAAACPEAGGEIEITNDTGKVKVDIQFDGTGTATYATSQGTSSFDLACKS